MQDRPPAALAYMQQRVSNGEMSGEIAEAKEREHAHVVQLSKSRSGVKTFLEIAPSDRNYVALKNLLS
jgi:hypothetical protein